MWFKTSTSRTISLRLGDVNVPTHRLPILLVTGGYIEWLVSRVDGGHALSIGQT
jgi:hypothetical protein